MLDRTPGVRAGGCSETTRHTLGHGLEGHDRISLVVVFNSIPNPDESVRSADDERSDRAGVGSRL